MMSSFICSGTFFPFTMPNTQRRHQHGFGSHRHNNSSCASSDDGGTMFGKQLINQSNQMQSNLAMMQFQMLFNLLYVYIYATRVF